MVVLPQCSVQGHPYLSRPAQGFFWRSWKPHKGYCYWARLSHRPCSLKLAMLLDWSCTQHLESRGRKTRSQRGHTVSSRLACATPDRSFFPKERRTSHVGRLVLRCPSSNFISSALGLQPSHQAWFYVVLGTDSWASCTRGLCLTNWDTPSPKPLRLTKSLQLVTWIIYLISCAFSMGSHKVMLNKGWFNEQTYLYC